MDLFVLLIGSVSIGLLAYGAIRFVPSFFRGFFITRSTQHSDEREVTGVAPAAENYDYKNIGLTTERATKAFVQLPKVTQELVARLYADAQPDRAREMLEVKR